MDIPHHSLPAKYQPEERPSRQTGDESSSDESNSEKESAKNRKKGNKGFKDKEVEKDEDEKEEDLSGEIDSFVCGDLVSFVFDNRCGVGFVRWFSPKASDRIVGIEPITDYNESPLDAQMAHVVRDMNVTKLTFHMASVLKKSPQFFISDDSEGLLWCRCNDRSFCLNADRRKPGKNLSKIPTAWLPLLLECDGPEERARAALSGQLKGVRFEKGERVLAVKEDDAEELEEATITSLEDGRVALDGNNLVTVDRIFNLQYLKTCKDLPWVINLLDYAETFAKNDVVTYEDEDRRRQVARLHWIGQVPWLPHRLLGIESLTPHRPRRRQLRMMHMNFLPHGDFEDFESLGLRPHAEDKHRVEDEYRFMELYRSQRAYHEIDERFVNYVKVFDVDKEKAILLRNVDILKIDKLFIAHSDASEGTLWCLCGEKRFCLNKEELKVKEEEKEEEEETDESEEEEEEKKKEKKEEEEEEKSGMNLSEVPIAWLPFLLACKDREERAGAALSGQLKGVRFENGERVLTVKENKEEEELEEATITSLEDGRVTLDESYSVTVNKIFRKDYLTSKPSWHMNLLPTADKRLQKDDLVLLQKDNYNHVGRLLWMGCRPGTEEHLVGIECISRFDSDDDQRFLNRIQIIDAEEKEKIKVGSEKHLQKIDDLFICTTQNRKDSPCPLWTGSLWCQCGPKLFLFDDDSAEPLEIEKSVALKAGAEFLRVSDSHVPLLLSCESGKRAKALQSGQLNDVRFEKGERVFVKKKARSSGDPEEDLEEAEIKGVEDGMIVVNEDRQVLLTEIFSANYIKAKDLQWTINLLDSSKEFSKDDFVLFQDDFNHWQVGRPLWLGQVPWEAEGEVLCIEALRELNQAPYRRMKMPIPRKDESFFLRASRPSKHAFSAYRNDWPEDSNDLIDDDVEFGGMLYKTRRDKRFLRFKRIADVASKEKVTRRRRNEVKRIDSFRMAKTEVFKEPLGSLWCISGDHVFNLDCPTDVEMDKVDDTFLSEIPAAWIPLLFACEGLEERARAALSGQLKGVRFEEGERVLAVKEDGEELEEATILSLEDGRVVLDGKRSVSAGSIYHPNYLKSTPPWLNNILPPEKCGKMATFVEDDQCHIGHLKYLINVPWSVELFYAMECLKEDAFDSGHGRLNYLPIMEEEEATKKLKILPVRKLEVEDKSLCLLKFEVGDARAKLGTLWCERAGQLFCWDTPNCLDRQEGEHRFAKIQHHLLLFLLRCSNEGRVRASLTEQLNGVKFVEGEKVLVRKEEDLTRDPYDDLQVGVIAKIHDGLVVVEEIGAVTVDRVFSPLYLKSVPKWAINQLGCSGFQHLPRDQEIEFRQPEGDLCSGKVRWFGQLPWFDDLTVGLELNEPRQIKEDLRFVEYIHILRCNANQACIIPFRMVPDDYVGSADLANFIEEPSQAFPVDSPVSFVDSTEKKKTIVQHGIVKWTGRHRVMFAGTMAVVVLKKKHNLATNGVFLGQRLVKANNKKALLIGVDHLIKLETLSVGDFVQDILDPQIEGPVRQFGPADELENGSVDIEVIHENRIVKKQLYEVKKLPPRPESRRSGDMSRGSQVPPIFLERFQLICGKKKGIQGVSRANFLDSLIFSAFAFSASFEQLLPKARRSGRERSPVQILMSDVVEPLRTEMFVPREKTTNLRDALRTHSRTLDWSARLNESLEAFFRQLLNMEPLLEIGSAQHFKAHFSVCASPLPWKAPLLQTSQLCFEFAFNDLRGFIKKMPENLILQLLRDNEKNEETAIVPSLTLDLKLCLGLPQFRRCEVCTVQAVCHLPQNFNKSGLESTFRCAECAKTGSGKKYTLQSSPSPTKDVESTALDLRAVICLHEGHSSAFVRCGPTRSAQWVFFDSVYEEEQSIDGSEFFPYIEKVDAGTWIRSALSKKALSDPNIWWKRDANLYHDFFHRSQCLIYEMRK